MATQAETTIVYAAAVAQGIALVTLAGRPSPPIVHPDGPHACG